MKKNRNRLATFVVLFAIATFIIHVINKIVAASAILKDMLDTDRRNYYKWRFGEVYYTKKGKGSPVLLIHDILPADPDMNGIRWRNPLPWSIPYIPSTCWDADVLRTGHYLYQFRVCTDHL